MTAPATAPAIDLDAARRLLAFCDASPSPYHACATAAALLGEAGFTRLAEDAAWPGEPGRWYVVRGGSLVAWATAAGHEPHDGFRIVGAHTDSPNLRIKPQPDVVRAGVRQLGVEAYGGVLLTSWLGRDLGLSGRVAVRRNGTGALVRLLRVDRPVCAIPQLAIHLDRDVNTSGLVVDAQHHLTPLWGIDQAGGESGGLVGFVAGELGVEAADVLGWDLMLHDLAPGALVGRDDELIGSARLDNLASCWAAVEALDDLATAAGDGPVPVVCLFDHEEVGSTSDRGAASSLLPTLLERSVLARGGDREALHRALARSACLSADMAHATHPNYADRHDPAHQVALNGGPVLKVNANVRYATDAPGAALVALAAEQAGVPLQRFAMRGDLPCGSTIGPVTAARLGISTVDVGMPQLAMHAAREHAGSHDPGHYRALLAAFLAPA
ncbi:MAG TPA: M18 family aminopeptidase [Acidimicrobiales bacterium]